MFDILKKEYLLKKAIVTGACGNLGSHFVRILGDLNYFIYAIDKDITNLRAAENIEPVELDITDQKAIKAFFSSISQLDVLVNNAGIGVFTPFEERSADDFKAVMNVNLLGTFLMSQGAIKLMKAQQSGKIVNLGSIYGVKSSDERIYGDSGRNNSEVYSMTKAGVIHLTKYMASHFGRYNIQTNCISPGGIYNGQSDDFVSSYEYKTPSGRMGCPEDITNALEFLCSNRSDYINGQNIIVDGGFVAW